MTQQHTKILSPKILNNMMICTYKVLAGINVCASVPYSMMHEKLVAMMVSCRGGIKKKVRTLK